jgi:hypothetical protein
VVQVALPDRFKFWPLDCSRMDDASRAAAFTGRSVRLVCSEMTSGSCRETEGGESGAWTAAGVL